MGALRFFAVVLIFAVVSVAWGVLSLVTFARTEMLDDSLSAEMNSLWGPRVLAQPSPYWAPKADAARTDPGAAAPSASRIDADIQHDHRYKGLLWYSTFTVDFSAEYTLPAPAGGQAEPGFFIFPLPSGVTGYDELSVTVDGRPHPLAGADIAAGRIAVELDAAAPHVVAVRYKTFGQEVWLYSPGQVPERTTEEGKGVFSSAGPLVELNDFSLTVTTDFAAIDYPRGTRSPSRPAERADGGMRAHWQYKTALTSQAMGVVIPTRQNAGPIVTRMSLFAPVSLLFFLTVLFTVVVLRKVRLHPMHYLFISAGFFAFHILLAYLADLFNIHWSFWISAVVSVMLVVSYMRLAAGVRFAVTYVGLAQLIYLVGFSYAFFWKGRTGLTVTIGAIVTLFVLMQATGRIDWFKAFRKPGRAPAIPPAPAAGESAPPPPPLPLEQPPGPPRTQPEA